MAKRTTGGRKPKTSRTKKAAPKDVVDGVAKDVTEDVSSKVDAVKDNTKKVASAEKSSKDVAGDATDSVVASEDVKDVVEVKPSDESIESNAVDKTNSEKSGSEEIVYTTPAAAAAPVVVRKGGFVPMLLGGAVAAGLGFAAAESDLLEPILPASWKNSDQAAAVDLAPLTDQIESQSALIAALEEKVGTLSANSAADETATALSAMTTELETMSGSVSAVSEAVDGIDTRLTTLEKAPVVDSVSPAAIEAYERELSQMSESIAAQRAEVEQILADVKTTEQQAAEAASAAEVKLALSNVVTAVDAGDPFAAELAALSEAGGPEIPDALAAVAESGLPTLSALQESFPALARQALATARAEAPAEEGSGGIGSFLQRSLGARSTTPREGDGPDAVLSRAEAALKDGDVETTLSEIEKLPDGSKTIMADWLAQAAARLEARSAADALAASLNTN